MADSSGWVNETPMEMGGEAAFFSRETAHLPFQSAAANPKRLVRRLLEEPAIRRLSQAAP